ncbi:zinc ribbon domain-containing protein [Bacillus sp. RAR_GA_16]|uniref:zinc ribbon domain-containing protein n=1 Tax=Bacillus sp. RAR_GA_16 TaxID=2876774 RepID=UPI001CCF2632|nr:zinc ribbon domain-containing protein [Bacillus sp. RAR_GA_16]MCA0172855.1 zinc ribbon domain-containing protein [Bacillus sp. RAR_GA_16]
MIITYCTTCGNAVSDNYCPFDGTFQLHAETPSVTSGAIPKFCSDCGTEESGHQYCLQCGSFQLPLVPYKTERPQEKVATSYTIPEFSGIHKKLAILCAFLAFLAVGIMSFVVSEGFQQQAASFQQTLNDLTEVGPTEMVSNFYYDYGTENAPLTDPFFGMTDYWMSAHLLNSTLSIDMTEGGERSGVELELQSGMLILLLLPLISLLIVGYLYGKRATGTIQQSWLSSLLIGLIYGGLTALIALVAGFQFDASVQESGMIANLSIDNNYPFIKAFFAAFFIGTVFSFIGSLYGSGMMKQVTSSPLKEGVRTITFGIAISISVMVLFLYRLMSDASPFLSFDNLPATYFLIIVFQGGFLLWNTLNLSSLTLDMNLLDEKLQVMYSALGGLKVETIEPYSIFSFLLNQPGNFKLYMIIGLLIPIGLFLWAGYRLHQGGAIQLHRIVVFGLLYAFMMSLLTAGLNTGFTFTLDFAAGEFQDMADIPFLFIGSSAIVTFFKCFIFSTLLAICGAYWKKRRME